jgi:hypothetical protein
MPSQDTWIHTPSQTVLFVFIRHHAAARVVPIQG